MKEQLIKKAKELGFNQSPKMPYLEAYYMWMCLLQKWLRDEHRIIVIPTEDSGKYICFYKSSETIYFTTVNFKTYEQALEKGLTEAMKLIKK